MKWRKGDRVEWNHMQLTRFNPNRYHGTIADISGNGKAISVNWDDGVTTAVEPGDITRERASIEE